MKKVCKLLFLVLLFTLLISCRRDDISLGEINAQPYVKSNGAMGLSVFFRSQITKAEDATMVITDPTGNLTWTLNVSEVEYQGTKYFGNSDISVPNGVLLPTGLWTLDFLYKDGRTVSETFTVSYQNIEAATEKFIGSETTVFDADSNLTFI